MEPEIIRSEVKSFLEAALKKESGESPLIAFKFNYWFQTNDVKIYYVINNVIGAPHMYPGSLETYYICVPLKDFKKKKPNICDYGVKFMRSIENA